MKLHVDLETLQLIEGPGFRNPLGSLRFKRGDAARLEVVFLTNGTTAAQIGDPALLELRFGIKPRNRYDVGYLVHTDAWTMPAPDAESPVYQCSPSFNTTELDSALGVGSSTGSELAEITLMGEITWREGAGEPTSTRTFLVVVENDVNRGTEGVPQSAQPAYPAPENIITTANLGTMAVRHDTPQTLEESHKAQARANIGAIGEIANGSLSIAKTSGLQSALNSKAAATHTHPVSEVQGLEEELSLKLGFRLNQGPGNLQSPDDTRTLLLEKDGAVYLYSPSLGAAIQLTSAPPPVDPNAMVTTIQILGGPGGEIPPTPIRTLDSGSYRIAISVAGFTTSSWGSHGLNIFAERSDVAFSNPIPGTLYDVTAGGSAGVFLGDPATAPDPQAGSVDCAIYSNSMPILIGGYLPAEGDTAEVTVTITPL